MHSDKVRLLNNDNDIELTRKRKESAFYDYR